MLFDCKNDLRADIQSIDFVMREIKKSENSYMNSKFFFLKESATWDSKMLDFFKKTEDSFTTDLMSVCQCFIYSTRKF